MHQKKSQNVKGRALYMKYMQGSTAETSPIPALKELLKGFNFLNASKVFGKQYLSIMTMLLKRKPTPNYHAAAADG